jgi:hypothetical protein
MAVHAQDSDLRQYQLTAVVQSDEPGDPIRDTATLDIRVLFDADFVIEEISRDPSTAAVTYRIINRGTTLTDLSLQAVDPITGVPSRVFVSPSISHARLATDDSIEFTVFPLFGPEDVLTQVSQETGIDTEIKLYAGGIVDGVLARLACPLDKQIYDVTLSNVCQTFSNGDWYCTNKDDISLKFKLPYYAKEPNLSGARVSGTFIPKDDKPQPHNVDLSFNGNAFGSFQNTIPWGSYSWALQPGWFKGSLAGMTTNSIEINTEHPNPGHYSIATNFTLDIAFDTLTLYQCASSREEAEAIVHSQVIENCVPEIGDIQVTIIAPEPDSTMFVDDDGQITIKAHVEDHRVEYRNLYSVEAELVYLHVSGEPIDRVVMMDNGDPERGDLSPGDRYFSGRWAPNAPGMIEMTVTAIMLNGEEASDTSYFIVEEAVDAAVLRVWQAEFSRKGRPAEVFIDVKNTGTIPIEQPMHLQTFYYYVVDHITEEREDLPRFVGSCQLLDNGNLESQASLIVRDTSFVPEDIGHFYVLAEIQLLDEPSAIPACEVIP